MGWTSKGKKSKKINNLEDKIRVLETKIHNEENIKLHNRHKREVDEIFDDIPEGIRVRSRCQWY